MEQGRLIGKGRILECRLIHKPIHRGEYENGKIIRKGLSKALYALFPTYFSNTRRIFTVSMAITCLIVTDESDSFIDHAVMHHGKLMRA